MWKEKTTQPPLEFPTEKNSGAFSHCHSAVGVVGFVGFQWCDLQRRTFPRNRAELNDLRSLGLIR